MVAKIKFDHSKEMVSEAVGVPEKRWDEMIAVVKEAVKKDFDKFSQRAEYAIKEAKPKTNMEYFMLGLTLARAEDRKSSSSGLAKKAVMAAIVSSLLDD